KRMIKVHAMTKPNDDEQVFPLGTNHGANLVCVSAGANGKSDTMILGGDDQRQDEDITTGANGIVETEANSGGSNFYPSNLATQADLISALRTAYSNSNGNHAAYIDFEVSDGNLALPYVAVFNDPSTDTQWAQYLSDNFGAGAAHPNNTYDVIGVSDF